MSRTGQAMPEVAAEDVPVQDPAAIGASIEVTRRQAVEFKGLQNLFPAGTWVYLNDIGTEAPETLVRAAIRLRDLGYEPVPHFAARRVSGPGELEQQLSQLRREADIRKVLIIAGDCDRPAGNFTSSLDLLETGLFGDCGITDIGVAGHPEGSPAMSDAETYDVLKRKQEFAARSAARMHIVTQFGFDAVRIIDWVRGLPDHGISLPVHLGIAGPTRLSTLLKFAARCGVGNSISFLKKNARSLTALAGSYEPDDLVSKIAEFHRADGQSPVQKLHVFPFGGLEASTKFLTNAKLWERDLQPKEVG